MLILRYYNHIMKIRTGDHIIDRKGREFIITRITPKVYAMFADKRDIYGLGKPTEVTLPKNWIISKI